MNQANSTGELILKSSCSCGRFGGFADLKISKRPQIAPWFLLDGGRRCGRYGHITRICCIGGKYMCVFTYVYSYRKTSATSARPQVSFERTRAVGANDVGSGSGGRCGRKSLDATADKPILDRSFESFVLRRLNRQDLPRINPTETTTCTQVASSYRCGSNANEQHDATQARQWRFNASARAARTDAQRRLLRGSSGAREAFIGLTEMPP